MATTVTQRPSISTTPPASSNGAKSSGFGTPPDKRTTALQSAVAVLRGKPIVKTEDVLTMAEEFYQFLVKK